MISPAELSKAKVVILVSGLDIGGAHGGAERFGLELSRNLPRQGFETRLVAFWRRSTQAEVYWHDILEKEGIPVLFAADWPGRFELTAYRAGLSSIERMLTDQGPAEILHSHYQMGTLAAIRMRSRRHTRLAMRTAHVSREWGFGFPSWLMRQLFTKWLYPMLLDAEVGVSQAIVDTLRQHPGNRLARKKPRLIHNAIYPDHFSQVRTKEGAKLPERKASGFVVGSIGRLTQQKGYRYLLEAAPQVLAAFPGTKFVVVGDGELRSELEQLAKSLGINQSAVFTGQQEDIQPYLEQMDLFVLPSLYEGLPTAIMESMACGVPVVATDIPGTRELVTDQDNGWLVAPRSPEALAGTIIAALASPELRSLYADRARSTVENYSIEVIAGEYAQLYRRLLNPATTSG